MGELKTVCDSSPGDRMPSFDLQEKCITWCPDIQAGEMPRHVKFRRKRGGGRGGGGEERGGGGEGEVMDREGEKVVLCSRGAMV